MKHLAMAHEDEPNVMFVINAWENKSAAQKKKVMQTLAGEWPAAEEDENVFFFSVKESRERAS